MPVVLGSAELVVIVAPALALIFASDDVAHALFLEAELVVVALVLVEVGLLIVLLELKAILTQILVKLVDTEFHGCRRAKEGVRTN